MFRLSLIVFVFFTGWLHAEQLRTAAIERMVESTRKSWEAPGLAVAIVHGDEVVFIKGFGVKKLGSDTPVTPDTRFAIGSTSKAFTTAGMGVLVDDGKMQWDDAVRKHVPFFRLSDPLADANVIMRDLVCHRTGLSRHDLLWYGSPWSGEEIIRRIGFVALTKPFRSAYQYQNIMFLTAGYAIGRISGTSWEEFTRARILTPLGMNNTDFSTKDVVQAPDYSSPHEKSAGKVKEVPWRTIDNVAPAGSINSSVGDLTRWVRMHLNGGTFEGTRILKTDTLREMHTPQMAMRLDDSNSRALNSETNMIAYGLGWTIQDYRGKHMVSHGGAIDGFRAQVTLLPQSKHGIVILSNLGRINMAEALRSQIADELLGLPSKDWNKLYQEVAARQEADSKRRREERESKRHKNTRPSRDPAAYAGVYENPGYGEASVSAIDGKLHLKWSNWNVPLEHFHFDTFQGRIEGPLENTMVEFRLDSHGEVSGLKFADQDFERKRK
jgi:CubicO group peptidase (beta-lactamase class C family)